MMKGRILMEFKYLNKPANTFASNFVGTYKKPATCPFCGYGTDAPITNKNHFQLNDHYVIMATCKCTSCGQTFFFVSEYLNGHEYEPIMIPSISFIRYENKILSKISERFIDMYNQALQSEFVGNYELAAIGYRTALEIIIKDFAINELGIPREAVVKKKLYDAIGEYLNQNELINTSDVVRILGNDHTHFERKYPQHDFELLKGYMDIFLKQIEVQYMIKHPPVSRTL